MKTPKYVVKESSEKVWIQGWEYRPKFQLLRNGEIICEMVSSLLMENIVRSRFNEMAKRFNEQPFEIDITK